MFSFFSGTERPKVGKPGLWSYLPIDPRLLCSAKLLVVYHVMVLSSQDGCSSSSPFVLIPDGKKEKCKDKGQRMQTS